MVQTKYIFGYYKRKNRQLLTILLTIIYILLIISALKNMLLTFNWKYSTNYMRIANITTHKLNDYTILKK